MFDLTAVVYNYVDNNIYQMEIHSSCEIDNTVETHLCKLYVIFCSLYGKVWGTKPVNAPPLV